MMEQEKKDIEKFDINQKWALISVSEKKGIVEFAEQLVKHGYKIMSTGGTAGVLREAGIEVKDVSDIVGEPIMGDKVKTLSREIAAGLLARRDRDDELKEMRDKKIRIIDLVCVDMYPLENAIEQDGTNLEFILKNTDVGGPTMLHEGAKGKKITISTVEQRQEVLNWLDNGKLNEEEFINKLNGRAEYEVGRYIGVSAKSRSGGGCEFVPLLRNRELLYGINPSMKANVCRVDIDRKDDSLAFYNFNLVAGTETSTNNLDDWNKALGVLTHLAAGMDVNFGDHKQAMMVGVKHGSACGVAIDSDPRVVAQKMIEGDPLSIFGGIVISNFEINEEIAEILLSHEVESGRRILDNIYAPKFTKEAIAMLERKKDKCRFLENMALKNLDRNSLDKQPMMTSIRGGMIIQDNFTYILDFNHPELQVHGGELTEKIKKEIILAWAIGCMSSSNTITIVKDNYLLGNGVGQQDRVGGAALAIARATRSGHDLKGSTAYSDSFFPFPDGIKTLIDAGVKVVFSSSGSVGDPRVIETAKEAGILLVMLPDKVCRGFRW
jgi:phosphoribosylaminoimidazolecarboxamide formyltransferase / IMP cyclohydrolase